MRLRLGFTFARLAVAAAAVVTTGGCSILFHADAAQCSSSSDCLARGAAFANHVCQAGTCVLASTTGDDGGGGRDAAVMAEASVDAGMDAPGEAGVSVEAGCSANADCVVTNNTHPEVACDLASGACLQLTTDECPLVIGDYSGKLAAPLFVGAFATLPPSAPQSHPSFLNYTLAIKEFTSAGGIPGWDPVQKGPGLRMPVAVICNANADVNVAMSHLQADIHVPSVVAALDSVTLRTTFVNDAYPSKTFMVNPFGADSTLTSLTTDGLLWHMLGQPSDNAPMYAAFLPRIEASVRVSQPSLGATPMRVATITGNATVTQDLAAAALKVMRWNGNSVDQNTTDGVYMNVALDSVLGGTALTSIDVSGAAQALLDFKPNVIVSFASSEFLRLLETLEPRLKETAYASNPKPFYLLGPYNMESREVLTVSTTETQRIRLAGVGVASASDPHVLNAYSNRFLGLFLDGASSLGQENYYDAMYFAVYAVVGAGKVSTVGGTNAAQGMLRLLSGTSYDMGPSDMGNIFGALGSPTGTISLFGALGPPDFIRATGARVGEGSVYCVQRDQANGGKISYLYDVLRLTPGADGGASTLGGTFPCYDGM